MKKNLGTLDRALRIAAAIIIAVLYYNDIISGTVAVILLAFSVIFILTSFFSFCPIYSLFGWSTRKKIA